MKRGAFLGLIRLGEVAPQFVDFLRSAAGAEDLRPCLAEGPVTIFGMTQSPHLRLPSGLLWGELFDKGFQPVLADRFAAAQPPTASSLIEEYWGSYLAILRDRGAVTLVRDPSGFVPCYLARTGNALLIASDARLLDSTGLVSTSIAWDEIAAQLQFYSLRTARTALADITELLPGTALTFAGTHEQSATLWSPADYARRWKQETAFDASADEVRQALVATAGAWGRKFRRPMLQISGGLDSSVVAASLAATGAQAVCVTFRGSGADLDERHYARLVAKRLGYPLVEEQLAAELVDVTISMAAHLPRPAGRSFSQADDRQGRRLALELGCDAFFTGAGGDNVFWYQNTVSPAIDRLRSGSPLGFFTTLSELADMCGVSRRTALAIAARRLWRKRPCPWPHDVSFLAHDLRAVPRQIDHPWLEAAAFSPPGVRAYVRGLIQMQDHFEYYRRAEQAPLLAPILSQPVVEACLAIPSWLWCRGGANRAVARRAFVDLLPEEIIARRSKGGFNGFAHRIFERDRATIREMLLDGCLYAQRMLDSVAIEDALRDGRSASDATAIRLLRLAAVEAWLQSWLACSNSARRVRQR